MASVLVLDAGILIASTFKETLTEKATLAINTWRQAGITFAAPTLFIYEVVGVAERLNCEFWTTDEKLFNAVSAQLPWVKWLGGFTPSQ